LHVAHMMVSGPCPHQILDSEKCPSCDVPWAQWFSSLFHCVLCCLVCEWQLEFSFVIVLCHNYGHKVEVLRLECKAWSQQFIRRWYGSLFFCSLFWRPTQNMINSSKPVTQKQMWNAENEYLERIGVARKDHLTNWLMDLWSRHMSTISGHTQRSRTFSFVMGVSDRGKSVVCTKSPVTCI
jgi:hypothetical protein